MPTLDQSSRLYVRSSPMQRLRKLALVFAVCLACKLNASAQEPTQEPPKLFRGGIVQQLRSLTEETFSSQRGDSKPEAKRTDPKRPQPKRPEPKPTESKRGGSSSFDEPPMDLPQPPALSSGGIQGKGVQGNSGSSSVRSNLRSNSAAPATAPQGSAALQQRLNNNLQTGSPNSKPRSDVGTPVRDPRLADAARFRLADDTPEANGAARNGSIYTANSKYDRNSKYDSPAGEVLEELPETVKVMPAETQAEAPKVSRRPLPTTSKPINQFTESKPAPIKPTPAASSPKTNAPEVVKSEQSTRSTLPPASPTQSPANPTDTSYPSLTLPPTTNFEQGAKPATPSNAKTPTGVPSSGVSANLVTAKSQNPSEVAQSYPLLPPPTSTANLPAIPALPTSGFPGASTQRPVASTQNSAVASQSLSSGPALPSGAIPLPKQTTQPSQQQNDVLSLPANLSNANSNPVRPLNSGGVVSGDEHLSMEAPRVQVLLKGPGSLAVGTPVDYQIEVRNQDSISLDGLVLRLEIPADIAHQVGKPSHGKLEAEKSNSGETLLTWSFDSLSAQRTATAPIQLVASQARNFAVAMDWTLLPKSGTANFDVRQARLELTLEGPSEVEFGTANSYRLNVRNPGTAVAKNVKVQLAAAAYGSSNADVGDIPPGEQQSIDVELTFHEKGMISISADATAMSNLRSDAKIDVLVKQAQLVAKLAGSDRVYHGAVAAYEAQIQNVGNLECRDVNVVLTLPPGADVISKPAEATVQGGQLILNIASIKPGQAQVFPVQMQMRTAGEQKVALSCSAPRVQAALANAITMVEAIADLKMIVNDPIAPAPVGGIVVYELSLTNRGSQASENVRILAQFSEGIEPLQADGAKHKIVPGQVIFDPIAVIEAGETKVLKIQAKADKPGTHRFRAEVKSEDSDVRLVQEETTQYLDAAPNRVASPMNNGVVR